MPFWTLRRKVVATVTLMIALTFGWAAVVVAVALTGAHDEARSADAIAVLGAAQYNGRPSPVFRARLDHAAALYQRGLAPVVLVTGGVGSGDTGSESEVGRRAPGDAGFAPAAARGSAAALCRPPPAARGSWRSAAVRAPPRSCRAPAAHTGIPIPRSS